MKANKIYPGMVGSAIEFFIVEGEVKFMSSGVVKDFAELTYPIIQIIQAEIQKDADVVTALQLMHPDSEINQLKQFVSCRFGGLDFAADISGDNIQNGEYWDCPLRGQCAHEGTLCKAPVYNNHRLSPKQIKLLQLTSTNYTNEVVGELLDLPMGSLHKAKKILYDVLGIQTKQEGALISKELNLI